jgi:hypothetical protein
VEADQVRVNSGRLDLKSLVVGEPCTITTGGTSIRMVHTGRSIEMGMYLNGVGMGPIRDDRLLRIEDEHGKGFLTYWLLLDRLAPRRLYTVLVTNPGALRDEAEDARLAGMPGWQISDDTPGLEPEPGDLKSGGPGWGLIGKLLGGRGG